MVSPIPAIAVGFVAGVLSGAFGVGGGVVTTPAIRLLFDAPALIAVGTPLPIIIPTAITGALSYVRLGLADVRTGVLIGIVGAAFSVAGAMLSDVVGGTLVMLFTAALILYLALDTARRALRSGPNGANDEGVDMRSKRVSPSRIGAIGVATGLYSGLLGLGGGFVIVPLLARWLRYPIKQAIATSLVAVAVLAVPGSIAHWMLGHVDVAMAGWLMLGVIPGALLGARLTSVARERHVEIGFAVVLLITGGLLAMNELGVL